MDDRLPGFPAPLTEVRYRELSGGRIECLKCHYVWKLWIDLPKRKDRNCRNCRCPLYPNPKMDPERCHPVCLQGVCLYFITDWLCCRNVWRVVPEGAGLVWKVAKANPASVHDLMAAFNIPVSLANQAFQRLLKDGWVRRIKLWKKPSDEADRAKAKVYRYPDGSRRRVKKRHKKPAFWQYIPTHWAMRIFRQRFPESFEMKEEGEVLLWTPIRIRRDRTPVRYSVNVSPNTPAQKRLIWERINLGKTRMPIGLPPNRI